MASNTQQQPVDKIKQKLLFAIRNGDADKVELILSKNAAKYTPDESADTANNRLLHRAARYGHNNVVAKLIELKADPNATNKFGMVPLHHATVNGDPKVIETLLGAGAKVNQL